MTVERPVLLVGYSRYLYLELCRFLPERSLVLVEEPDAARKGKVHEVVEAAVCRELIEDEYLRPCGADSFFLRHRGLAPAMVLPGHDYAVPVVARLAEHYGLPGAGQGAAQVLRDKRLMRVVSSAAGIANPVSRSVDSPAEIAALWAETGGPLILKPANRQGAIGTRVIRDRAEIQAAWRECTADVAEAECCLPEREVELRMLAEQLIIGPEFSVEMLVRQGRRVFGNVTEKALYEGVRPVEQGHCVPAQIPAGLASLLLTQTERLLAAIAFGTGMVHCEWIVQDGVPYLVECAGRLPGDCIPELIKGAYDFDVLRGYADLMRGGELDCPADSVQAAVSWHGHADPGVVVAIDGAEEAAALPGVLTCRVMVKPGETVNPLRSSWDRTAVVTAFAPSAAEALETARRAIATIEITTTAAPASPAHAVNPEYQTVV